MLKAKVLSLALMFGFPTVSQAAIDHIDIFLDLNTHFDQKRFERVVKLPVNVYRIGDSSKALDEMNGLFNNKGTQEDVFKRASKLFQGEKVKPYIERIAQGEMAMAKAMTIGLNRYPAFVVNDKCVIYGLNAFDSFKKYKAFKKNGGLCE